MLKNSYSIVEFCYSENISKALFYKILKEGNGPKIMKVGRRTLISAEAATEWRKRMEQNTEVTKNG